MPSEEGRYKRSCCTFSILQPFSILWHPLTTLGIPQQKLPGRVWKQFIFCCPLPFCCLKMDNHKTTSLCQAVRSTGNWQSLRPWWKAIFHPLDVFNRFYTFQMSVLHCFTVFIIFHNLTCLFTQKVCKVNRQVTISKVPRSKESRSQKSREEDSPRLWKNHTFLIVLVFFQQIQKKSEDHPFDFLFSGLCHIC